MRNKTKLFARITAATIITFMMIAAFMPAVVAVSRIEVFTINASIVDALDIKAEESISVIVSFKTPSSYEKGFEAGSPEAIEYEQKLVEEQNAALAKLGLTAEYNYTALINAVAVTAKGEDVEKLENTRGIEKVYVSQEYKLPETTGGDIEALTVGSSYMTSSNMLHDMGFTGDGVTVAVIDTGLKLTHEAFNDTSLVANPVFTPESLEALNLMNDYGYHNEKVPFYFDYVNGTAEGYGDPDGHGTHVSGIAAGYATDSITGQVKFSGLAPGAQICSMRVFDDEGRGSDTAILAALEDVYRLDVDIVNLSLGSHSGFSMDDDYFLSYHGIYGDLEEVGTMVICAAGNSGSMATDTTSGTLSADYMDYGTVGTPATYIGNLGVGSANGLSYLVDALFINGIGYSYTDYPLEPDLSFVDTFNGETVDIVYIDALGYPEDFEGVDVDGKIVAVNRGEISFTEKVVNAAECGAIGVIVVNYEDDDTAVSMALDTQPIPAIFMQYDITEALPLEDYVVEFGSTEVENPNPWELSSFSSVGVTPDLQAAVDILGIGGGVTSADATTDDGYVSFNGTSMAAPCISGVYALMLEVIRTVGLSDSMTTPEISDFIDDLLMSTATLLYDSYSEYYSPRMQGMGLADVFWALTSPVYIHDPLKSLGYDASMSGAISVEYVLESLTDTDESYVVDIVAITDYFVAAPLGGVKNTVEPVALSADMFTYQIYVDGVALEDGASFTVPAGKSATVKVDIQLTPDIVNYLASIYTNGFFIDGYVMFYDAESQLYPLVHGGFISFVGDWLAAPAIEPNTITDIYDWLYYNGLDPYLYEGLFFDMHPNANFNYSMVLTGSEMEYILGQNPLAPNMYIPSNPDRLAISTNESNADSILYDVAYILPSLLRNCKDVTYVIENADTGEIYGEISDPYIPKDASADVGSYYGFSGIGLSGEFSTVTEDGELVYDYLPSGTNVVVSVYTTLDYPGAEPRLEWQVPITIDSTAPEVFYDYDADSKTLTVTSYDEEYLAGLFLIDDDGNLYDAWLYAPSAPGQAVTEIFDLSGYASDSINILTSDYASNLVLKTLYLEMGDISNIESTFNADEVEGLDFEFDNAPSLYKDFTFTVAPSDGYCLTEDFALSVNGTEIAPVDVLEDGTLVYSLYVDSTELNISAAGVMLHDYVPTVTKEESCTEAGELSHICSNCSHVGAVEVIEPHEHERTRPITMQAPTCTETGLAIIYCAECDAMLLDISLPATGHTAGEFVVEKEATCSQVGYKVQRCTDCGEILAVEEIPTIAHTHGEVVVVKEATCQDTGIGTVSCTVCSELLESVEIPKIAHTEGEFVVTKEATCSEKGLKVKSCTVCDKVLATEEIDVTEHKAGDFETKKEATCTENGLKVQSCTDCGKILKLEEIKKTEHTHGDPVTVLEATCTSEGLATVSCTACNTILSTSTIPATGHSAGSATVEKEPTTTEAGLEVTKCTHCEAILKTDVLPMVEVPEEPATGCKGAIVSGAAVVIMAIAAAFVLKKRD